MQIRDLYLILCFIYYIESENGAINYIYFERKTLHFKRMSSSKEYHISDTNNFVLIYLV